ncbi:MAG: hypothetical protein CL910_13125 [Deltaproteobacteria bacterium]|jgi:hypothetical protein|nr:hypothetical protein [Deltaproteobacteria bacterium]
MIDFLFLPQNFPFAVALTVMLGIAVMEGVATLVGAGLSGLIEAVFPDFDLDVDMEVDADGDAAPGAGFFTGLLGWLHIGRVPVLVLLVILLTGFGLLGLALQALARELLGAPLPGWLVSVPAFLGALPIVRVGGAAVARIIPREETSAVSRHSFVGRVATIVIGTARSGEPTQARLRDEHGRSHYVMVEPDLPDQSFAAGCPVLLVREVGPRFRVIAPPSDALLESNE